MDFFALIGFLLVMTINEKLINSQTHFNPNDTNRKYISYIILAIILIIAVVSYFVPKIPCEPTRLPFSRRHSIILDTYNAKIPYALAFIMLFLQFDVGLVSINFKLLKTKNTNATTALKIGSCILTLDFLLFTCYLYALIK